MQQFTIRTRLLMLVGAMFIGFITIELMGFSALQRGVASLNTVYLDRVVPLRDGLAPIKPDTTTLLS